MGRQLGHALQRREKWAPAHREGNRTAGNHEGVPIPEVKHHRHLGLVMNNKLSWTEHIKDVHGTCSRMIGVLCRLRRRLQAKGLQSRQLMIFIGAIRPRMEYASQVWSGGPTQSLQRLQDSFCKRHGIQLPPLQTWFDYHSLVLLYKMRSSLAPPYLCTLLPRRASATTGYSFRKSGPSSSHKKITWSTLSSFVPQSIVLWNALPKEIQESNTLTVDQVQNPTKNPFTYLMSSVAFFKLQMICFIVFFFLINCKSLCTSHAVYKAWNIIVLKHKDASATLTNVNFHQQQWSTTTRQWLSTELELKWLFTASKLQSFG